MSETAVTLTHQQLAEVIDEAFISGSEAALETILDASRWRTRRAAQVLLAVVRASEPGGYNETAPEASA